MSGNCGRCHGTGKVTATKTEPDHATSLALGTALGMGYLTTNKTVTEQTTCPRCHGSRTDPDSKPDPAPATHVPTPDRTGGQAMADTPDSIQAQLLLQLPGQDPVLVGTVDIPLTYTPGMPELRAAINEQIMTKVLGTANG